MKYAYSIKTMKVKEKDFPYEGQTITCTRELVEFAKDLHDSDIEKMVAVYLDAQNKVICINLAVVYPREILRHALIANASAFILIHNHPSGNTKPSDADIRLTRTISEAGRTLNVLVHDHLILGEAGQFFSFREEGLMPG
jgi:DNA repair protein RadC